MKDNSSKQNAKFLGEFKEDSNLPKPTFEVVFLKFFRSLSEQSNKKQPDFFIGNENGITDIDTPPSDN